MNTDLTRERPDPLADLVLTVEPDAPAPLARDRSLPPALRPGAPAWIWMGIGLAVVGFVLIAIAWGAVAGEDQVYRQIPYVVSGALVGLVLVLAGLTVLNIATRQRDGVDRDEQVAQLMAVIEELRATIEERDRA